MHVMYIIYKTERSCSSDIKQSGVASVHGMLYPSNKNVWDECEYSGKLSEGGWLVILTLFRMCNVRL